MTGMFISNCYSYLNFSNQILPSITTNRSSTIFSISLHNKEIDFPGNIQYLETEPNIQNINHTLQPLFSF